MHLNHSAGSQISLTLFTDSSYALTIMLTGTILKQWSPIQIKLKGYKKGCDYAIQRQQYV